ncbi:MAG: PEP-CTERM sorting domain-containing protein [Bryobacteraceae bacterium]
MADRAGYFLGGQFSNVVGISWTQSDSFSDVTIDADIVGQSASFDSVTAYLMSAAGPGTTALSEVVAPASVTVPTVAFAPGLYSGPPTVLFADLVLGPGTYFLVLTAPFSSASDAEIIWQLAGTANTTLDPSVTLGNTLLANTGVGGTSVALFAPASTFESFQGTSLLLDVTTPVDVTTPEPGTVALVSAALAGLVLRKSALFQKTNPNA